MELQPLTEAEADQLKVLLERAINNTQFGLRIQDLDENGTETHSGHGSMDCQWVVTAGMCSGEQPVNEDDEDGPWEEYEQAEVHVFISDETAQYLAGNHPVVRMHRERCGMTPQHPDMSKRDE